MGEAMATGEMALQSAETIAGSPRLAEAGLLEQCRAGDAQAFARLVSLYQGMVFSLGARLLGDPEEARDLAQDVFLQVYRTLPRFRGQSSLKTWIYRIVVNQAHNRQRFWRRRRRDRSLPLEELQPAETAQLVVSEGGSPYETLKRRERQARVQLALLQLSFEHRAVLLLREMEEMSCEEIAAALELPEGTVKSRLARARDALRERLVQAAGERQ